MGLDLYLYVPADQLSVGCSYGGFAHFRHSLCESAGLGDINRFVGFGGTDKWPDVDDEPLVALLNHSDCDGELWHYEVEGLAARIRDVTSAWDGFGKEYAEAVADLCDRAIETEGVVVFR